MIIHYTIAKNTHQGKGNALRLEQLIRDADVVSPESAFMKEKEAQRFEVEFKRMVSSSGKHRRRLAALSSTDEYATLLQSYIVKYQKPVVLLERFSDLQEVKRIEELLRESEKMIRSQVPKLFHDEELETGMKTLFDAIGKIPEVVRVRDRTIGDNARGIRSRIAELYPHLASRPELHYLVIIGKRHHPEHYMETLPDATVKTIDVSNPHVTNNQMALMSRSIQEGATYESCRPHLAKFYLAYEIFQILPLPLHHLMTELSYLLVMKLGLPDAEDLSSQLKTTSEGQRAQVISEFFGQKGVIIPRTANEYEETYRRLSQEFGERQS